MAEASLPASVHPSSCSRWDMGKIDGWLSAAAGQTAVGPGRAGMDGSWLGECAWVKKE